MPEPLLVVGVQHGFINDFTRHVPGRIKRLIEMGEYAPVLFTLFVNTPDSPYQRLLDWHGCAEPPQTDLVDCCASTAGLQAHLGGLATSGPGSPAPAGRCQARE